MVHFIDGNLLVYHAMHRCPSPPHLKSSAFDHTQQTIKRHKVHQLQLREFAHNIFFTLTLLEQENKPLPVHVVKTKNRFYSE